MKNILIIEDDYSIRNFIIGCLGASYFKEENFYHRKDWLEEMKTRIKKAGFSIKEINSNGEVIRKYPEGLPIATVVVLDGDLLDGSSKKIFPLFSDEVKKLTLIHTASWSFPKDASEAGFKNFFSKNSSEADRVKFGETLLEMFTE